MYCQARKSLTLPCQKAESMELIKSQVQQFPQTIYHYGKMSEQSCPRDFVAGGRDRLISGSGQRAENVLRLKVGHWHQKGFRRLSDGSHNSCKVDFQKSRKDHPRYHISREVVVSSTRTVFIPLRTHRDHVSPS